MPSNMRNVSKGMEVWNIGQDATDTFITIPDLRKRSGRPNYMFPSLQTSSQPCSCTLSEERDFEGPSRGKGMIRQMMGWIAEMVWKEAISILEADDKSVDYGGKQGMGEVFMCFDA